MKFGGTSLGSAERIARVSQIIRDRRAAGPLLVVVSAMGETTDTLVEAARAASQGEIGRWRALADQLEQDHLHCAQAVAPELEAEQVRSHLLTHLATLRGVCDGISRRGLVTAQEMDSISSLGELMAAVLVASSLRALGLPAESVDSALLIVTDDHFGQAAPLLNPSRDRIQSTLKPMLEVGIIPVVTGFRAETAEGQCTTLGRGGSDYTATILGTLLPADEIWIWTDVDGVMTADPRLVPHARVIPELSYREAIELAFFGAKVLHPNSMELPHRFGVPVRIRNTLAPERDGTTIAPGVRNAPGVRAIAHTSDARLFTVGGADGVSFTKVATSVLRALDEERVPTLMVTQSSADNVFCFAVDGQHGLRMGAHLERLRDLESSASGLGSIDETPRVGIVVVVGEAMRGTPGIAARLFGALAERHINVVAISQGSSELSVSAAVLADELTEAVVAIHHEFAL